jgi:thiol-disulfide isomerase/thioredoxin
MRYLQKYLLVLALLCTFGRAHAFEKQPYSEQLFLALAQTDEVVLVDVYAPWCPTCKKQQKAIGDYIEKNPDKPIHVLVVDFDNDKATVRKLRAPRQSTLLIFKNGRQFWYSVAETRAHVIAAELDKARDFKPKKKS